MYRNNLDTESENFQWDFYVTFYDDLKYLNKMEAFRHWMNNGKNEGRVCNAKDANIISNNFDWKFYITYYDDLRDMNEEESYQHWINNGKEEGRICNSKQYADSIDNFDWHFYTRFYNDLKNFNISNAYIHWNNIGRKEKRICNTQQYEYEFNNFDWVYYTSYYDDLKDFDKKSAFTHWINYGKKEGRLCNKNQYDYNIKYNIKDIDRTKLIICSKHSIVLENIINNFILKCNKNEENNMIVNYIKTDLPPMSHLKYDDEQKNNYIPIICFPNTDFKNRKIPKVIHKIFLNDTKNKLPNEIYEKAILSWQQHYPEFEIKIYDKNDAVNYIQKYYGNDFLYVYNLLIPYAFKADFLRICILYNEGGIYSDLKQQSIKKLNINMDNIEFFCSEEIHINWQFKYKINFEVIQNCLIGCFPKHPYIKAYLDLIIQNILNERYNLTSTDVTGPFTFGRAINSVKKSWYFMHNDNEVKMYFNVINENNKPIYFIDYMNKPTNNYIIKHKYDNTNGADWSSIKIDNNNYDQLWRNSNIYNI